MGYYRGRSADSLTAEEIMTGLDKYRQEKDLCKVIYFFRYAPYKKLGRNMENVLRGKDIYIELILTTLNYNPI